jgi:hypothetical protein
MGPGGLLGLTAFIPQLVLLLALTYRYAAEDIGTCICLQTVAFVALNKVSTVQYWVWYFALVPLCLARCGRVHVLWWVAVCTCWAAAVGLWLSQAYRLEMLGDPTWIWLVVASAALLSAHMLFLVTVALHTRNPLLGTSTQMAESKITTARQRVRVRTMANSCAKQSGEMMATGRRSQALRNLSCRYGILLSQHYNCATRTCQYTCTICLGTYLCGFSQQ